jgi:hypothetical protein
MKYTLYTEPTFEIIEVACENGFSLSDSIGGGDNGEMEEGGEI